jgi:hypothetical protein
MSSILVTEHSVATLGGKPLAWQGETRYRGSFGSLFLVLPRGEGCARCLLLSTVGCFTEWAQQRNVETGVSIRDATFALQLRQQFEGLVQSRAVLEVPGFRV